MIKLFKQFMKFGVVGVICFFIDFGIYTICNLLGCPYLISGVLGFSISVSFFSVRWGEIIAKIFATGIVMVFNFVTRKLFLEKR